MERSARFGDWSEHMSSSGKKYYYNCKTEVSQWEKPREWISRTENRQRQSNDYSSRSSTSNDILLNKFFKFKKFFIHCYYFLQKYDLFLF